MANYNTGVNLGFTNGTASSVAFTGTVPAGVLAGDVMIVAVDCFTYSGGSPAFSVPTSGGGSWSQIGTTGTDSQGSLVNYATVWQRVATASDPGSTFSISFTGTNGATNAYYWTGNLDSYTGFYTASPIGNVAQTNAINSTTITTPATTTTAASSWQVQVALAAVSSSGTITGSPAVNRQTYNPFTGVDLSVSDSNGSVGAAGTSIGGGSFTCSASTSGGASAFTIELRTQAVAGAVVGVTPPRIPHPLWFDLLEVAYSRANWQAQGVATLAPFSWRLFDGVNGRPGTSSTGTQPPASATANGGNLTLGTSFYVTQGGMWFQGYWWYVCPSGGQPTGPQQFALWSVNGNLSPAGQVVPGSVVTSGTLSTGWNYVPLPQPVPLGLWSMYTAATGTAGPYPQTASQTNSGGPYSAGWSNGPVTAYSDLNGSNPPIYPGIIGNGSIQAGGTSNPAVTQPKGNANGGDLFWIDIQVTNVPPAGYQWSYRLWPNMYDADPATTSDSAVNYVIGTEFLLSQPCLLPAVWYYAPAGMGTSGNQWATSADVWNVRTGQKVATNASPVWLNGWTNQVDGQSNSGRWVYCQMPGQPVLPAGDYYVSVYNGNGSPNGWGSKRFGYWEHAPLGGIGGSYAPGANGITTGPLYAPPTPLASTITDYNTPSVSAPGQSVFAAGPPNQFPDRYVGTPTGEFQNYWVDVEVIPVTSPPVQPDLPQRIPHPLLLDLIEVAQYRADGATPLPSLTLPGAAALSGAGALSVPGVTLGYSGALTGSGALSVPGETLGYSAAMSGSGTLSETVALGYAAALTGTGTLSIPGVTLGYGASLAGSGTLAVPGVVLGYSVSLSGSGSLTAAGALAAAAVLDGEGTLTPGVTLGYAAALSGSGLLAAAGVLAGGAALSGSGTLAVPGVVLGYAAALAGAGTLTATGVISGLFQAAAALAGSGSLTVPGVILGSPAALSGSGTLTAAGALILPGAAALSGTGTLAGTWILGPSAALSGSGTLAGAWLLSPAAALSGAGLLTATPAGAFPGSAVLTGTGLLAAAGLLITPFPFTGIWTASPLPSRWQACPAPPRWKATLMNFGPVAAISLEEINVNWTSDLAGTFIDPTGATAGQPALAVQFAFPQSSGNPLAPAEPVTWYAGTWLTGTNIRGYVAQCLVGPGGGVVTLTAGLIYDAWTEILGSPESPRKYAGQLPVY